MDSKPVNLTDALASFDDIYSPRIVTRMNDYDVRIAHAKGEHLWHTHTGTDEMYSWCRRGPSTSRPRRAARS
jgi:hypothetical protein